MTQRSSPFARPQNHRALKVLRLRNRTCNCQMLVDGAPDERRGKTQLKFLALALDFDGTKAQHDALSRRAPRDFRTSRPGYRDHPGDWPNSFGTCGVFAGICILWPRLWRKTVASSSSRLRVTRCRYQGCRRQCFLRNCDGRVLPTRWAYPSWRQTARGGENPEHSATSGTAVGPGI